MKRNKRSLILLLTAALMAGTAFSPMPARAEEGEDMPGEETVLSGDREEEELPQEELSEEEPFEEVLSEGGAETFEKDRDAGPAYVYEDEIGDMEVPVGRTYGNELSICAWREDPETEEYEEEYLDLIDAVSDDPSVAQAQIGEGVRMVEVTGKSTGRARITVTYADMEGGSRTTEFTVHVKDAVYVINMYSSLEEEKFLEEGDQVSLWITAEEDTGKDFVLYDEEDVTFVWSCTCMSDEEYADWFSFSGEGSRARLSVKEDLKPGVFLAASVEAAVYRGSEISEDTYMGTAERDFYIVTASEYFGDPDAVLDASALEIVDDPASESLLTVTDEEDRGLKIRKWAAMEILDEEDAREQVDYPFEGTGPSLSTRVNGALLADLVGTDREVEFYAVLEDEDGREVTTEPVVITVYAKKEELSCDIDDLVMLPGEENILEPSAELFVRNVEYPEGKYMDAEILGAGAEDASVARVSWERDELIIEAGKAGTTAAWLLCRTPEGKEEKCPFTVTVSEARYEVCLEDSFEDYEMVAGDRADLSLEVTMETVEDCLELEEDDLEIRWEIRALDGEDDTDDFSLVPDGKKAVLSVTGKTDPGYEKQVLVTAHVYLKGSDTEIGSDSTEHSHVDLHCSFKCDSSLEDETVEVGESFTIKPYVLKRKELEEGETSTEKEERAVYGLVFDPAMVRVTDRSGREIEPSELDDEEVLIDGLEGDVVYTVTRLSKEEIEIAAAARWPGEQEDFPCSAVRYLYLDPLEEGDAAEDPDDPDDPDAPWEPEMTGDSGAVIDKNISGAAAGRDTASRASSKTAASSGSSPAARRPVTGDGSHAAFWVLLAAASLSAAAGAACQKKKQNKGRK